jgi:hypothetical protein
MKMVSADVWHVIERYLSWRHIVNFATVSRGWSERCRRRVYEIQHRCRRIPWNPVRWTERPVASSYDEFEHVFSAMVIYPSRSKSSFTRGTREDDTAHDHYDVL